MQASGADQMLEGPLRMAIHANIPTQKLCSFNYHNHVTRDSTYLLSLGRPASRDELTQNRRVKKKRSIILLSCYYCMVGKSAIRVDSVYLG